VRMNTTGTALAYSTFLGGSEGDFGQAIAVDRVGNAYVTGGTQSIDFPTTPGAFQRTLTSSLRTGSLDNFVSKLALGPPACLITHLTGGPPAQLQVAVHADRGLSALAVTGATNATLALPTFAAGSTVTFTVVATKIDQSRQA